MKQRIRLLNQLHEQLCIAYPSYKQFFKDISRPTALYFWGNYPSGKYLKSKTVEELRAELVPISHNKCSTKTCQQALICISRRLISIIYGMLKDGTEYRMPVVESAGEK